MAGLPLGEPPLRAAEGGSDRTRGVYQAIEHEPLAGDDTKNGVETSRGGQATLSVPKYQWNPTQIGAEVESEGREIFAQQIHRCHMGRTIGWIEGVGTHSAHWESEGRYSQRWLSDFR